MEDKMDGMEYIPQWSWSGFHASLREFQQKQNILTLMKRGIILTRLTWWNRIWADYHSVIFRRLLNLNTSSFTGMKTSKKIMSVLHKWIQFSFTLWWITQLKLITMVVKWIYYPHWHKWKTKAAECDRKKYTQISEAQLHGLYSLHDFQQMA